MALSSITSGKAIRPPRIMLSGTHGIGKTTFAAGAPSPIFIQTEEGADTVGCDRFPLATSLADVLAQLTSLCQDEHAYGTVVIDSLDCLEPLIWKKVAADAGKKNIEDIGYGKGLTIALDEWRQVLDGLTYLRNNKSMIVILISHVEIKRFDNPETEPYDRYIPRLHAKAGAMIMAWADAVLFANYKVFTKTTEAGFNKDVRRGIGTGDRVIYTTERPSHLAKNRYNLPSELPLSWGAFVAAIAAGTTPAPALALVAAS